MSDQILSPIPSNFAINQEKFLPLLIEANQAISKLDGLTMLLPNYEVLIHPLLAQESVASNEIENINTTMMQFLQQEAIGEISLQGANKEVQHYRQALLYGIKQIETYGGITTNLLIELQAMIEPNKVGIRKIPGTVIANSKGEVLHTPPQGEQLIRDLMSNLEQFINASHDNIDPLIKVAIIHHQFESIHPFYDGNGRIGRILIILYLILTKKITKPVLFLSSYILSQKQGYYNAFHRQNKQTFDDMIAYILQGVVVQAQNTQDKIITIHHLIDTTSNKLKSGGFKEYHAITMMLFSYPFMTVQGFANHLGVTRQSISELIKKLESQGHIQSIKAKNSKLIYLPAFIQLLSK